MNNQHQDKSAPNKKKKAATSGNPTETLTNNRFFSEMAFFLSEAGIF